MTSPSATLQPAPRHRLQPGTEGHERLHGQSPRLPPQGRAVAGTAWETALPAKLSAPLFPFRPKSERLRLAGPDATPWHAGCATCSGDKDVTKPMPSPLKSEAGDMQFIAGNPRLK